MAEASFKSEKHSKLQSPGLTFNDFHYTVNMANENVHSLKEKLDTAYRNIHFIQEEHVVMIKGLHSEIERLQNLIKALQFQYEVLEVVLPDNEFFNCDIVTLEQKVDQLISDNYEMKRRLSDTNRMLESVDQKQQLERWQHKQEIEEKDKTIIRLEQELESKCSALADLNLQLTQRRKRGGFLRRFAFNSNNTSTQNSSLVCAGPAKDPEQKSMAPAIKGTSQNLSCDYSSISSLSDKSTSDDEMLKTPFFRKQYSFPASEFSCGRESQEEFLKLPPLPGLPTKRQLVRQQLRLHKFPIAQNSFPEMIKKRSLV